MRIAIFITILATSLAGCVSYSRHERQERVVARRSGGYYGERHHRHGGHYRHGSRDPHHDHHRHHDARHRHHPRGG